MGEIDDPRKLDISETQHAFEYDIDAEEELGTTVTTAVASVTGSSVTEVGNSLTANVDLDGLNRLFRPSKGRQSPTTERLVLVVDGCLVTIASNGHITVET